MLYDSVALGTKYRYILVAATSLLLLVLGTVYLVYDSNGEALDSPTPARDSSQVQANKTPLPQAASTPLPVSDTQGQAEIESPEANPLFLTLDSPSSLALVVKEPSLVVRGKTRMDALLTVGSDAVEPNLDGVFSHTITLEPGHNIVEILASTSTGEQKSLILAVIYTANSQVPDDTPGSTMTPVVIRVEEKISVTDKSDPSQSATPVPTSGT